MVGQRRVTDAAAQQLEVARGVGRRDMLEEVPGALLAARAEFLGPGEYVLFALGVNGQPRSRGEEP